MATLIVGSGEDGDHLSLLHLGRRDDSDAVSDATFEKK